MWLCNTSYYCIILFHNSKNVLVLYFSSHATLLSIWNKNDICCCLVHLLIMTLFWSSPLQYLKPFHPTMSSKVQFITNHVILRMQGSVDCVIDGWQRNSLQEMMTPSHSAEYIKFWLVLERQLFCEHSSNSSPSIHCESHYKMPTMKKHSYETLAMSQG